MSSVSDDRGHALHAAVVAAPDDDQPRHVYADWLLEQADPRGELIAVQLELATIENAAKREILAERERTLRTTLARALPWKNTRIEFERGFVRKLSCDLSALHEHFDGWVEWTCLRELEVGMRTETEIDGAALIADRLGRMALLELRLRGLSRVTASFERLVSSEHLAALEHLDLWNCALDRAQLAMLAQRLATKRLRMLGLARNPLGRGGFAPFAAVEIFEEIEHLDLLLTGIGAEDVDAIFDAGLPLTQLELSGNELGPAAARRIAASPQSAWLTHLGLAETGIGEEGIAALINSQYLTHSLELTLDGYSLGLEVGLWEDWDSTICGEQWAGTIRADLATRFRVSAAGSPYIPPGHRAGDYWQWERQQGRPFTEFRS